MEYKQFIQHCKVEGFTWAKIYKGKNLQASFPKGTGELDVRGLLKCIDEFAGRLPGDYIIELKRSPNTPEKDMKRIKASLGSDEVLQSGQVNVEKMREDIEKEVLLKLKQAEQEKEKDNEIRELKRELADSRLPAEKLIFVLTEVATKIFPNQINAISKVMTADNLQGSAPAQETENMTEADKYNAAFDIFEKMQGIDGDFMLKLARKVNGDTVLLAMVKRFVG